MNIVFFTKHELLGASSRYRSIQYFPFFKSKGIEVVHQPLFSDDYLKHKYKTGKAPRLVTLTCILRRITFALSYLFNRKDILIIEKELVPYFPPLIEWLYRITNRPFYLDYDDAVWHNYDQSKNKLIKIVLGDKHKYLTRWSAGVICGSDYILNFAQSAGAQRVIKIPTVINLDLYNIVPSKMECSFVIGWIGSPSSSQYLKIIEEALCLFTDKYAAVVHLIGVDKTFAQSLNFNKKIIEWSSESENKEISHFNVGIMPLKDSLFEQGKCSFKLIQYMGMGKPVICSPVGENVNVVINNVHGFSAVNTEEWFAALEVLFKNENIRRDMGDKGRELVEKKYSLQVESLNYLKFISGTN